MTNLRTARVTLPPHARGLGIGLLGGSFNPPHDAHRRLSLLALKRLRLDRIWWLVTPGNPLKNARELAPLAQRTAAARALAAHPRIAVTDIEACIGTRYSIDTLRFLRRRCPGVRFVWLIGADSQRDFHRWRAWRRIFHLVPIAVVDRGGASLDALASPAAQAFGRVRVPEAEARLLADRPPPAWIFIHGLKSPLSSTALRRQRVPRGG